MKVLCLNYEYPPLGGGGATVSKGLAEELVKAGHEVDLVTSRMSGLSARETIGGVDIHRVNCLRRHLHYTTTFELLTQVYPSFRRALALIRERHYDLIHTHFIYPTGLVSYLLNKVTGLPYIITVHGSDVPGYNPDRFGLEHKLSHPLWRAIVRNSAGLICPSNHIRGLLRISTDHPATIIPNGITVKTPPVVGKKNKILVVSRLFKRKGVQFLLNAIRDMDTDWKVLIVGDGPYLNTLKALAKGIRTTVEFTGYLQGKPLQDLYHTSKIFVFMSLQENFPVVLLEAMEAGCAIIASDIDGAREVIGDAGVTTPVASTRGLKDALKNLMSNEAEIRRFSELSLNRVREFDWHTVAQKYAAEFTRILDSKRVVPSVK
jgi:glycosyltransferase involved in cell wall biosynthesis